MSEHFRYCATAKVKNGTAKIGDKVQMKEEWFIRVSADEVMPEFVYVGSISRSKHDRYSKVDIEMVDVSGEYQCTIPAKAVELVK